MRPLVPTRLATLPFPLRLGVFFLTLAICWLPLAALLALIIRDANALTLVAMSLLFVEFLILLPWWARRVNGIITPLRHYGLVWTQQNGREFLEGLSLSVVGVFLLFGVQGALGWLQWQWPQPRPPVSLLEQVLFAGGSQLNAGTLVGVAIAEGLLIGGLVALAEELLFRGWLLDELQRDYRPAVALAINSLLFATLHYLRPINEILQTFPQYLGLVLLGVMLVWAKWATGRLGLPIGLHGGLVWGYYMITVAQLVRYTGQVPDWVTGVGGNPLAGAIGFVFLLGLVTYVWGRSRRA